MVIKEQYGRRVRSRMLEMLSLLTLNMASQNKHPQLLLFVLQNQGGKQKGADHHR
jgi:hypothetical protein